MEPKANQLSNAAIFNTLRILKGVNPGDAYLEAYLGHYAKRKEKFFDLYHLAWWFATEFKPKFIMEIGVRTGISICQMLSALYPINATEKVVLFDIFNDGYCSPEIVKINLKHLNIPIDKIEFFTGSSLDTVPQYKKTFPEQKFDWILVDGDHIRETARKDLENVVDLVEKNGLIVMDDLSEEPGECALLPVWNEFKEAHKDKFIWSENLNGKGIGFAQRI